MKEDFRWFPAADMDTTPFWVNGAGITYPDREYRISREKSDIYVFEYVMEGIGHIVGESHAFTVSEGDVYILRKGMKHSYRSDEENPWQKIWFNVDGRMIEPLLEAYSLTSTNADVIIFRSCDKAILEKFEEFKQIAFSDAFIDEIYRQCSVKFFEIITCLNKHLGHIDNERSREAYHLKSILDSKIQSNITLEELAESIYRSKAYVIRIFKEHFKQTPYNYLLTRRIAVSKSMLAFTSLSVREISDNLCFADQHYFSNAFKKVTGMSPTQYKKQHNI